jgi:hypothetical protein
VRKTSLLRWLLGHIARKKLMNATAILDELSHRIMKRLGTKSVADVVLAREIAATPQSLAKNWRDKQLTPRMVVNLMERIKKQAAKHTIEQAIVPIIEFFFIDPVASRHGTRWELFSASQADTKAGGRPYLAGLKEQLNASRGIYVFHDSRGRAIYAGKALRQSLWTEMNLAFNRDRGEVQSIKRVDHPVQHNNRAVYKVADDGRRLIKNKPVALHEIASYMSAYEVDTDLIGKLEALIVRAFANDLLNVRMENLEPRHYQ